MRTANRVAFLCILFLALISCAMAQKPSKKDAKTAPQTSNANHAADPAAMADGTQPAGSSVDTQTFIIGAEDVLNITIITTGAPSTTSYAVQPDGYISVPLIGQVKASATTPAKLGALITQKLIDAKMFVEPNVTVTVSQVNSRKAYISGDGIGKPGVIPLAVPTKVSEAIAYAGGFRDFANKKKIHIVRGSKVYTYNDNDVAAGKHLEQDITLEPGDHIYVK